LPGTDRKNEASYFLFYTTTGEQHLGVKQITDFPLQTCTELVLSKNHMQLIESFFLDNKIDTIVFHNLFDIQQNHMHASTISYVAGRYCDNLIMFQSNKYILRIDFYPRYFIDITGTIELKEKALKCFRYAHNRCEQLFERTTEQNRVWGYQIALNQNATYAKALSIIKFTEI
jgi:LmbE family N-acetylglucosaminyl deacetylase